MFFCYVFLLALHGKITIYYAFFVAKIEQSMTKESSLKHKKWLPNEKGLATVNLCYEQRTLLKTSRRTKCLIHLLNGTFNKRGKGRCYKIICLYWLSVLFINQENVMLQIILFWGCWSIFILYYEATLYFTSFLSFFASLCTQETWIFGDFSVVKTAQVHRFCQRKMIIIIIDCLTALCIYKAD